MAGCTSGPRDSIALPPYLSLFCFSSRLEGENSIVPCVQIPNHTVLFSTCVKSRACNPYRFSLQEATYVKQMDCCCGIFHCKHALYCQM